MKYLSEKEQRAKKLEALILDDENNSNADKKGTGNDKPAV